MKTVGLRVVEFFFGFFPLKIFFKTGRSVEYFQRQVGLNSVLALSGLCCG